MPYIRVRRPVIASRRVADKPKKDRDPLTVEFGERMRMARLARGISQEELAERCDLHRTEISLLERGEREPRFTTVAKVAGSLGISAGDLLPGMAYDRERGAGGFYVDRVADKSAREYLSALPRMVAAVNAPERRRPPGGGRCAERARCETGPLSLSRPPVDGAGVVRSRGDFLGYTAFERPPQSPRRGVLAQLQLLF